MHEFQNNWKVERKVRLCDVTLLNCIEFRAANLDLYVQLK